MYKQSVNTISEEYRRYLESDKWKQIRERILLRDNLQCRLCGSTEHLHCHHIHGRYRFHEENHPECLMILCEDCHNIIHSYWKICDSIKAYYEEKAHQEAMKRGYYR